MKLFPASADGWTPLVLTSSSIGRERIAEVRQMALAYREPLRENEYWHYSGIVRPCKSLNELTMLGLEKLFHWNRAVFERLPLLGEEVCRGA